MRPNSRTTATTTTVLASLAGAALLFAPPRLAAQADSAAARADSAARAARPLEPVVITAERARAPLAGSAAAVTRLSGEELRRLPARTVSEALQFVPGIAVLQADGLGDAPRLVIRGFYGGGETEYVSVLLDGVPLTGLAAGTVNWDLVPLASVHAIEVVRGGASALYGDAAVGGVVNLVTRSDSGAYVRTRAVAGQLGTRRLSIAASSHPPGLGGRRMSVITDLRRSDGYRAHERRKSETLGGSVALLAPRPGRTLDLSVLTHNRTFDEPGPLSGGALAGSRTASSSVYRFDATEERLYRAAVDGSALLGGRARATGYLADELAESHAVRTQPLSPDFADTKARAAHTARLLGSFQTELTGLFSEGSDRLLVGTDFSAGRIGSAYRTVMSGDEAAYAAAFDNPDRDLDALGRGRRTVAAGFASWEGRPWEDALRITLGGRVDWVEDRYAPRAPSEGDRARATHVAFSPRAGVNLRYADGARQTGHAYVTAGRSFKAPTMDQLFDQRSTPVEFPPYSITTSNPLLEPQTGKGAEVGAYHQVALPWAGTAARLALSVYQMDMKDELDFDFASFRYVNLGRSRHRGVETGLTVNGPAATSAFVNYTRQEATSRFGENRGKFLKAIPRDVSSVGAAYTPRGGLSALLAATHVGTAFLDDPNARRIPAYTRLDARASAPVPVAHLRLSVDVRNLLDRKYSSTAFPDPAGSDLVYYYPAAGRVVMFGVESGW